jgi:hypothetical protein
MPDFRHDACYQLLFMSPRRHFVDAAVCLRLSIRQRLLVVCRHFLRRYRHADFFYADASAPSPLIARRRSPLLRHDAPAAAVARFETRFIRFSLPFDIFTASPYDLLPRHRFTRAPVFIDIIHGGLRFLFLIYAAGGFFPADVAAASHAAIQHGDAQPARRHATIAGCRC